MQVLLPSGWPRPKGYANGVSVSGRQVYVAGMIGWDAEGVFHSDDLVEQVRQAMQNIVDVLTGHDSVVISSGTTALRTARVIDQVLASHRARVGISFD